MKLVQSKYGWWVHGYQDVALLPEDAAPLGVLTHSARTELEGQGFFDEPPQGDVYFLTVLTATDCNMGCGYCFQNTGLAPAGSYRQPRLKSARLNEQTRTQLKKFIRAQMEAQQRTGLHVLLFGGEPLLNPQACLDVLRDAQELGLVGANMISNAYLLKPALAADLQGAGLDRVKVTFDGAQSVHDSIRATRGGKPTYQKIIHNLAVATEATGLEWDIRINISHDNVATIQELASDLTRQLDGSRCTVDFAIVDDVGIGYSNELSTDIDSGLSAALEDLLVDLNVGMLRAGFSVAPAPDLGSCMYCKDIGALNGAVVNADGTLYSCWESAGKPGWDVGTLEDGYGPAETIASKWVACDYDRVGPSQRIMDAFFDRVESRVLDWQFEQDLL